MTTMAMSSSTLTALVASASRTPTAPAASMTTSSTPKRGDFHVDHGINLGGEELDHNWNLIQGNHFQYTTQCHNINASRTINKNLTEARECESILKFQGKLVPSTGIEKELDRETFNLSQLISEYVQEQLYYIKLNIKVVNVLENYYMNTMQNMIDS